MTFQSGSIKTIDLFNLWHLCSQKKKQLNFFVFKFIGISITIRKQIITYILK